MTANSNVSAQFTAVARLSSDSDLSPLMAVAGQDLETEIASEGDTNESLLDAAAEETKAIYSEAPISGPAWFVAKVQAQAVFANRIPGTSGWTIGNGPGSLGNLTPDERKQKADEENQEWFDTMFDVAERERERIEREWDSQMHDFAGMQMSGEEIDNLMDFIRDPKQRQALIERRAKEKNISVQQATKDVDNALRYGELYKKVQIGQATPKEIEEYRKLGADPNVIETVKSAKKQMTENFAAPDATVSESRHALATSEASTSSRAELLDSEFPSAPQVKEHFDEAKAATVPLDAKPVQVASATPVKPSPQVTASGFDV